MPQMIDDKDLGINNNAGDQFFINSKFGFWEYNNKTGDVRWSKGFYNLLGYEPGEIPCSYDFFADELIYHEDRRLFLHYNSSTIQIRLLTKKNGFRWFELITYKYDDGPDHLLYGQLTDIHQHKLTALKSANNQILNTEIARIAKIGSWQLDVGNKQLTLDDEAYAIFDLRHRFPLTVREVTEFFDVSHRQTFTLAIENAIKHFQGFDLELLYRSAKNKETLVRCKAVPVINENGKTTFLRGMFQAITTSKDSALQRSVDLLEDRNKRLQSFAYIVSHNLRSYTGSLQAIISLYEKCLPAERDEIFAHLKTTSDSLNNTITQLNDVVKLQSETAKEKKPVAFEPIFKNAMAASQLAISTLNARVEYDFNNCAQVNYIGAYLQSIFENLLTNALKYSCTDRTPIIFTYTYIDNGHVYLVFKDNGIGIDMDRFGDRIFGMYETFHQNNDAKGIGLYITRTQVESLGGTIQIDSKVNVGTTFTIRLD